MSNKECGKKSFINNTIWIIAERIVQLVISLIVGMISVRYLGPENYGNISYIGSFIALFNSISTLGLEAVIVKHIIEDPEEVGEIIGTSIGLRIISSTASIIGVLSLVSIFNPNDKLMIGLALLQSLSLIFMSFEVIDFWFQANLNSKYSSIAKGIASLVVALWKIYLLVTSKSVVFFAFSVTIQYIITAIILVYLYFKQDGVKLTISVSRGKVLLSESYHFILSGLMIVIYNQMDKIMIGQMLDTSQVGIYTAATSIPTLYSFVFYAIINSARPVIISERKKENYSIYLTRIKQLYAVIIWTNIIIGIITVIFSNLMIFILYGKDYMLGQNVLNIATWTNLFAILGVARGIWIVAENKNKYVKKILAYGAVVNLILNMLFIPKYGINGAAIATLITQIVTCMIAPLFYKETRIHTKYLIESFILKGVIKNK